MSEFRRLMDELEDFGEEAGGGGGVVQSKSSERSEGV